MKNNNKALAAITATLLESHSPTEFQSWLFDRQNEIILHSHRVSYTEKGSSEMSSIFATLNEFFKGLTEIESVK